MSLNTLTAEGDWSEDYVVNGQSYVSSDELFFAAPDYEEIRLCEDTGVHKYWESGLTIVFGCPQARERGLCQLHVLSL